jgi:hypothetical protein
MIPPFSLLLALPWLLVFGPPSRDDAAEQSPGARREPEVPYRLEALPPALESRVREVARFRQGAGARAVPLEARRAFVITFNQWTASDLGPDRRLRVCFLGGNPKIRRAIAEIAREWTKYGNVNLDFGQTAPYADPRVHLGPDQYEIHVTFACQGEDNSCWSLIGTEAKKVVVPGDPTMGFPEFDVKPLPTSYLKYHVLHEFGHALGLEHEHQKHRTGCRLDLKKVASSLRPGISDDVLKKQFVESNHFDRVGPGIQNKFDPKSVMNYELPADWFEGSEGAACAVGLNFDLSAGDKQAIALLYGKRDSNAPGGTAADPDEQINIVIRLLDSVDLDNISPEVRLELQRRLRALAIPVAPDH